MGAFKDIYDIVSEVTAKIQANRLKKRGERSRDELESYTAELESRIEEIQSKLEELQAENENLIAENTRLKAGPPTIRFTGDHGIPNLY